MVLYLWFRKDNWFLFIIIIILLGNKYVILDLVIYLNLNLFILKVGIIGFVFYNLFFGDIIYVILDLEIY